MLCTARLPFFCKAAGWSSHIGHRKVDGVCVRAFCTFKMRFVMEIKDLLTTTRLVADL